MKYIKIEYLLRQGRNKYQLFKVNIIYFLNFK